MIDVQYIFGGYIIVYKDAFSKSADIGNDSAEIKEFSY
jgi:hypothetical protein